VVAFNQVVVLCGIFLTLYIVSANCLFYSRAHLQPILARGPNYALITGCLGACWAVGLTVQLQMQEEYPCVGMLWTAYVGVILTLNIYFVRAFNLKILFRAAELINPELDRQMPKIEDMTHRLTQTKIVEKDRARASDLGIPVKSSSLLDPMKPSTFEFRNTMHKDTLQEESSQILRKTPTLLLSQKKQKRLEFLQTRINPWRILKICLPLTLVLLVPPTVVTYHSEEMRYHTGTGCLKHWNGAAICLAMYAALYFLMFAYMSAQLRKKIDGFFLKTELKFTAWTGGIALIPFYIFNNDTRLEELNDNYNISTIVLFIALFIITNLSLVYPSYLTYFFIMPDWAIHPNPDEVCDLDDLFAFRLGCDSFHDFLPKFAKDYAHFWNQVELFREDARYFMMLEKGKPQWDRTVEIIKSEALRLHDDFLKYDSQKSIEICQDDVVKQYALDLERCKPQVRLAIGGPIEPERLPTIFDPMQEWVFDFMDMNFADEYFQSEEFQNLKIRLKEDEIIRHTLMAAETLTTNFRHFESNRRTSRVESSTHSLRNDDYSNSLFSGVPNMFGQGSLQFRQMDSFYE